MLRVDGGHVAIEGDEGRLDRSLPALSLSTGKQVRFEDDPEDWARSLPTVLHAPDFEAVVVEDSSPPKTPIHEREPVAVEEAAAPPAIH
ncbi:MAG: hypothetical protein M3P50_11550 [Actinomycetota bacterium]|nr:hypothetical protein [Actinomycetota bacterium]